jgi:hypothetical protein
MNAPTMHTIKNVLILLAIAPSLTACNDALLAAGHLTSLTLSCVMLVATLNMDKIRKR